MSQIGTAANPLRVAIIGSGPTGFYTADHLLKQKDVTVKVDMYDRLPTPYGLVRFGVAPDHQKIKSVIKAYERTAKQPNFRFFGYVEYGKDITLDDLKQFYHQVIFTTGAQSDRKMGIPGEDLKNSHPATEFVAWYNGHPSYRDYEFDLSQESVAVVGVGNVAMDVARILSKTVEELETTDIADYALEALKNSQIKTIYILGRRGPAQAAFTNPEIKELGELAATEITVPADEAALDPLSQSDLDKSQDRTTTKKIEIIQEYAQHQPAGKPRQLILRFLVSPVELIGDEDGNVKAMRLVKNELYETENGTLRPKPTDQFEEIPVGMVFRSVGYRGIPLPEIPFHDRWGVINNETGRITDLETKQPLTGLYTAGWIKRGPTGVIGTNKPDAVETVTGMLEDAANGNTFSPAHPEVEAVEKFIAERQPKYVSFDDWLRLDEIETSLGSEQGRPRVKLTSVEEILAALGK
ncbi:MAG: FAD-dependent oxidoreductase [Anaerolineales bacterium]|nr:FAD-dependent oxidoreductase [Anaerolineales bacterium]